MATTAIDSLRGILNGFRDLNSKGIYTMNATETDLLTQILLEVQALSLGGLVDGSVTTAKIADLNVTTAKIADLNVTTAKIADLNVTTAKIADDNVTEAKLSSAFKQSLFNRNYLKNPTFLGQGTASGTLPNSNTLPTASLGYPGETEWFLAATGTASVAYAFSPANESVTFTGAASNTNIFLGQRIESVDAKRLVGKTVTFSFECSNSLLTTVRLRLWHPTTSDNTFGTLASGTVTVFSTSNITINSTLTRYSVTFTVPANASRGIQVLFDVTGQTSGTWVIARPQLEEGSIATDFACDEYAIELHKCRRYFLGASLWIPSAAETSGAYDFPTTMFATPVVTGGGAGFGAVANQNTVTQSQTTPAFQSMAYSAHLP
jgi:hypothetical protein